MPLTNTDVDNAIPAGGSPAPSIPLTNAALKQLITDINAVAVGGGTNTVNTFADLPAPGTVSGQRWWVLQSSGVWLVNRKTKGAYYSDGASWSYLGDFPVTASEVNNVAAGGISAGNVQAAIDELDTEKAPKGLIIGAGLTMASARLLGRTTAGTGDIEELTGTAVTAVLDVFSSTLKGLVPASGGGTTNFLRADGTWAAPPGGGSGSPGGTTGAVQFNNAGAFAGATNVRIEDNELRLPAISTPATPTADGVKLFGRAIASRVLPAFIGPNGINCALQPHIGQARVAICAANPAATAQTSVGMAALQATGTATAANIGSTNLFASTRRVDSLVTVAATNAVAGFRGINTFTRGGAAGMGGFSIMLVGGPATGPSTTGGTMRFFMGLFSLGGAPTDADPSPFNNIVGLGCDAADTNMQIMHNDATGNCTKVNLGSSFPKPTADRTDFYELILFCEPNGSEIVYQVTNKATGAFATGTMTTDLPATTTVMAPYMFCSVGGTSSVVGFTFMQFYAEVVT